MVSTMIFHSVLKIDGFLPALVSTFSGLSALGSLAGSAAEIVQAATGASAAKKTIRRAEST